MIPNQIYWIKEIQYKILSTYFNIKTQRKKPYTNKRNIYCALEWKSHAVILKINMNIYIIEQTVDNNCSRVLFKVACEVGYSDKQVFVGVLLSRRQRRITQSWFAWAQGFVFGTDLSTRLPYNSGSITLDGCVINKSIVYLILAIHTKTHPSSLSKLFRCHFKLTNTN